MPAPDSARLKVLFAGPLAPDNLTWFRCLALEGLGPEVVRFDGNPFPASARLAYPVRLLRRLAPRVLLGPINRRFVEAAEASRPDVVFVDKGIFFTPSALRRVLAVRSAGGLRPVLLHFHPDDAFHPIIYHALYEKTVRLYDCHFLPHRWVIDEHRRRGAKRVEYWPFGFHPPVHSPVDPAEIDPAPYSVEVAFAGRWERPRAAHLERLATEGIDLGVWGSTWGRLRPGSPLRKAVRSGMAWGRALAAVACYSKISLGFLSETNRNGHTSRTFEIPASGGFMLAERSDGQLEFFEEGREIECFGSWEELRDKVRFYLSHQEARERIRGAGLARCLSSGYTYADRMRVVLKIAEECRAAIGSAGS